MIENTVYSSRCYFIMAVVSFFMADVHFPRVTLTNNTVWFNFVIYNFILNSLSLKKKKTSHLCATQSICNRDPAEGFGQTSTFFQSFKEQSILQQQKRGPEILGIWVFKTPQRRRYASVVLMGGRQRRGGDAREYNRLLVSYLPPLKNKYIKLGGPLFVCEGSMAWGDTGPGLFEKPLTSLDASN